jgi:DNA-binding response OmpR family regulator
VARILVVDDDLVLLDLLQLHLRRHGHSVSLAADAVQALQSLVTGRFDLVLTDLEMPYLDGLEFIEAIRSEAATHGLPIVVLTARQDDESWIAAKRLRVNHYLNKPTTTDDLVRAIDAVLNMVRASDRMEADLV